MSNLILRVPWSLDAGIGNEPEVLAVLSAPIEDLGMTVQRRTTDSAMDVARVHRQFKCAAQVPRAILILSVWTLNRALNRIVSAVDCAGFDFQRTRHPL